MNGFCHEIHKKGHCVRVFFLSLFCTANEEMSLALDEKHFVFLSLYIR